VTNEPERWADRPTASVVDALRNSAGPVFSEVFAEPATGQLTLLVAARADNGVVAIGAVDPAAVARRGLEILVSSSDELSVWVVAPGGRVIFQGGAPVPEADLARHAGVAEALRGEAGETYLPVGDEEHMVAYSPVAPVGWALVMEEPWHSVDNALLRSTLAAPLVLIPVVLISLLALGFGIRQIVQPLRRLAVAAGALGLGQFEAVEAPVGGITEIRHLQAELVHMARQVRAAQQSVRGYVSAVTRGQEDERRRLARELHDGPVQALIALDQRVQMVQLKLRGTVPEANERLTELRQMTGVLLEDVRRVIRALRQIYLEDLGLLPALEMLAQDLETTSGIPVMFGSQGTPARLTPEREIAAYRFAQEALSNIARHSQATEAAVETVFEPGLFTLHVRDNGRGFAPPVRLSELAADSHFGLVGMQERAELVAGRMAIGSEPGQGTSVELRLPTTLPRTPVNGA
jgi:signal transduction histidine kinase